MSLHNSTELMLLSLSTSEKEQRVSAMNSTYDTETLNVFKSKKKPEKTKLGELETFL